MKKLITMVALVAAMYGAVSAQMSITPKVGLNMASLSGEEFEDFGMRFGFKAAAELNINMGSMVTGVELAYAQKGASYSEEVEGLDVSSSMNLTYLEINPVLGYAVPAGGLTIIPRLKPSIGIFLGGTVSSEIDGEEIYSSDLDDDMIETIDFGLDFGIDAVIAEKFVLGVGYNLGLMDISGGEADEAVTNGVIGITAGYKIGL